jgi:hypothetical protein
MSQTTHRSSFEEPARTLSSRGLVVRRSNSSAIAATVLLSACDSTTFDEGTDPNFRAAARLYEDGHWEYAFKRFTALADDGHAPAAKLALLMLRYGRSLYGTGFEARPVQVARWAQCVLRATSRATASPNSMTASA